MAEKEKGKGEAQKTTPITKQPEKGDALPDTQFIGPDGKKYWKNGHAAVKEIEA
ncbi:MAG: hypothetical protein LBK63_06890 [Treponema sp.]|jgi:hypothetical protein|nr:hypothetical protein [Treponema sp.]